MFHIYNATIAANEHSPHDLSREEATVLARITSRTTQDRNARTFVVLDENHEPVEFFHNGQRFVNFDTALRERENADRQVS